MRIGPAANLDPAPRAVQPPAVVAPAIRIAAASTLDLTTTALPPVQPGVAVNMNGRVRDDGALAASGTVTIDRGFMEKLVRHVTRKPRIFGGRDVRFDPASGSYKGTVQIKAWGIPLTLDGKAVPIADGGLPGFKFPRMGLKLGPVTLRLPGFEQLAARLIASEITESGIKATAAPGGVVRLDPTSLLRDIDVLPLTLKIDPAMRFGVRMAPNGDVHIDMQSPQEAPGRAPATGSRVALAFDQGALYRVLSDALGPEYQLEDVTVTPNTLVLDGKVEVKPVSDAVNMAKGLLAAIAAAKGVSVGTIFRSHAMIGLQLKAQLQGTQVLLTPSITAACEDLQKTLADMGLVAKREGKGLRFDVAPLLRPYGVERLEAGNGQVTAQAQLDVNQLIKAPILRGEAW